VIVHKKKVQVQTQDDVKAHLQLDFLVHIFAASLWFHDAGADA
jgi:hypothetical protein